ncbi:DUF1775 domain-containing protein [Amycolatopsis rhizosphaerae]|uniref:DUF1775 domain-containing protein n=1 Tax=Amycolatopsis rhizosphaerae TaxID=2053003 RepID=A0A558DH48_9PSEU|nr:DUF1775 domain-containing protein [Amycolatopsis rhizosphaerae]TVT60233.1 DUF1775 domain-containing protein [Amycolatopsis rhizosphaerae]
MNRFPRTAAPVAGAAAALVLLAGPAQAHVRVQAPQAVVGMPATLRFRVPSEEQVAGTIRLSLTVPADLTVTGIDPVDGWTATPGAGSHEITWTAQPGHQLRPDQAADFTVHAGPLPEHPSLGFVMVQIYSNGDMVAWDQIQAGPGAPEFPSPVLTVAGASAGAQPDLAPGSVAATQAPSAENAPVAGLAVLPVAPAPAAASPNPLWCAGGAILLVLAGGGGVLLGRWRRSAPRIRRVLRGPDRDQGRVRRADEADRGGAAR